MVASQLPNSETVVKAGEVMATLNDWRAILFVCLFIIIALIAIVVWMIWTGKQERHALIATTQAERERLMAENADEREKMRQVADKFGTAAEKIGETNNKLVIELQVLRAVASRVEATTGNGEQE